jgi:CheY-like chemotaxis protein
MKVLIAEDDAISRRLLEANLKRIGCDVLACENGDQAWEMLRSEDGPQLAVLDWMMPVMDGAEVCRRVREQESQRYVYLILLTARGRKQDRAEGFDAGADDYLTKPFDIQELRAKITVGQRILDLQAALTSKVVELQDALCQVKQLQGLLPICMHCKKIRDDEATWHPLETYIERRSEAAFTHSLCPGCLSRHYPENQARFTVKSGSDTQ